MVQNRHGKAVKLFWFIVMLPVAALGAGILLATLFAHIPSFDQLENPDSNQATLLISEDGKVINTYHIENRSYVSFEDIPPHLVNAAVATEDARFYKHSGIDFRGLLRVGFKTLLMGDASQGGGSTITQQLAKTLYPRESMESSIPGMKYVKLLMIKMKEWITAVRLERNYTKDEIIAMYLNQVFFGSNAYGIRSAARTFFAKDTRELSVEEGACLVGMVNKPTRYNPVINYDLSLERRNHVLHQMEKYGYLKRQELDSLEQLPIVVTYQQQDHNAGLAPYFRDMLRRVMNAKEPKRSSYAQVEDYRVDSIAWKDDPFYGWLNKNPKPDGTRYDIDRDGLKIYTTIDSRMQKYAEEAVAEHLGSDLQKSFNSDLRHKRRRPFSNDVSDDVIKLLMKQAVRWSDRYMSMKRDGISESKIMASFEQPVNMRVFAWNKRHYIDTVMTLSLIHI